MGLMSVTQVRNFTLMNLAVVDHYWRCRSCFSVLLKNVQNLDIHSLIIMHNANMNVINQSAWKCFHL